MKKKKVQKNKINPKYSNLVYLPIIFIIAFLPYIMYYAVYDTHLSGFNWFPQIDAFYDLFLYYRQIYLIISITIMLAIIIYKFYKNNWTLKFPLNVIPLICYVLLALFSTILSEYSFFGYRGMFEQFESIFVIVGYCIIVLYCLLYIKSVDAVEIILKWLTISVLGLIFIGFTQYLGADIITSDLVLKLIYPKEYWGNLGEVRNAFGENTVYLTLYNPNYVGVYVALVLPIYAILLLNKPSKKNTYIYFITIIGILISLIGSKSESGLIGLIISFICILIFQRKKFFKNKIVNSTIILSILIIILSVGIKIDDIKTILIPKNIENNITEIKTEEKVLIEYKNSKLYLDYIFDHNNSIIITLEDENKVSIPYNYNADSGIFEILDERFKEVFVVFTVYNNQFAIEVTIDNTKWMFTKGDDGTYYYINRFGKLDKIITAESKIFTNYTSFASGRGYIWSRTVPLLKDYIVLGSGADTFAIVFPQQDYVNLYNHGFGDQVLTKPHNMYLQIAVQSGVLSLIAFLVFYMLYFISSIRLYINSNFETKIEKYGLAFFLGTIGYMVTGLTNDSSITVAPVFWVILGMGITINHMLISNKIVTNKVT